MSRTGLDVRRSAGSVFVGGDAEQRHKETREGQEKGEMKEESLKLI